MPSSYPLSKAGIHLHENGVSLEAGSIRLDISGPDGSGCYETYTVLDRLGNWCKLLQGAGPLDTIDLEHQEMKRHKAAIRYDAVEIRLSKDKKPELVLSGETSGCKIKKHIESDSTNQVFRIRVDLHFKTPVILYSVECGYRFLPGIPDFTWAPCLRPGTKEVIADQSFRSPALVLGQKEVLACLVPDLSIFEFRNLIPSAMNMDCTVESGPMISYGLLAWQPAGHVSYLRLDDQGHLIEQAELSLGYHLYMRADVLDGLGYRGIANYLWSHYGRDNFLKCLGKLSQPLRSHAKRYLLEKTEREYCPVDLPGIDGGIIKTGRARWSNEGTNRDAWFTARYQSLRTAYGLQSYGLKHGIADAQDRAIKIWELALSAPQKNGLFPSIFCLDEDGQTGTWFPCSNFEGYSGCYHALDCSWTGYWHLKLLELNPTYGDRVLKFLLPYGDFLLSQQSANGSIPAWYDALTLVPLKDKNPFFSSETSASALFLASLYEKTGNRKYLEGACQAMDFVSSNVVMQRHWSDFETFLSNARIPFDLHDHYTDQPPQSMFSIFFAVSAYLELFKQTRNKLYLRQGQAILDYLSLYQQVWSPPFFSAALFGGFGTQNMDSEWSDARSCYAADLYFKYFDETGEREYFERGVSAMRSVFLIAPFSNWCPNGTDRPGPMEGPHYGPGSAAVSAFLHLIKYGDLFINLADEWSCSLENCWIENLEIDQFRVSFDLRVVNKETSSLKMVFSGLEYGVYRLRVNGRDLGTFAASELRQGISISP